VLTATSRSILVVCRIAVVSVDKLLSNDGINAKTDVLRVSIPKHDQQHTGVSRPNTEIPIIRRLGFEVWQWAFGCVPAAMGIVGSDGREGA
jgi:hypothetical protein